MDVHQILSFLYAEKKKLEKVIASLEASGDRFQYSRHDENTRARNHERKRAP
jgi:hypothetical protein